MAFDDSLSDEDRSQLRAKLYDFVSDPMNRHDPELDRARRLLGKMSKAQAPEAMSPQPKPPVDTQPSGAIHGELNPNVMASNPFGPTTGDKILTADVNDQNAVDKIRGRAHPPSELEHDIIAQGIVGDAMGRPLTAGAGMLLGKLLGKTTGGEAAQFLRSQGEPMSPQRPRFGESDIFEAPKPHPDVATAQEALQFKVPSHYAMGGAGAAAYLLATHGHAALTPLTLLLAAAKNAAPIAGRVGMPVARALEEGTMQAPALEAAALISKR